MKTHEMEDIFDLAEELHRKMKNIDILKKARRSRNMNQGSVTISHLSSIRIEPSFKTIEKNN